MSVTIDFLDTTSSACEAFVANKSNGKICHLSAWSMAVAKATGLRNLFLVARNNDEIVGVLPLIQVRSLLFGNRMVSQAFSNYGGPLTNSEDVQNLLFNHAVKLAIKFNCESIEFRTTEPLPYNLISRIDKICMHLPLTNDPEELWKSFDPKVRNQVRKAEKSGIEVQHGQAELLNDFYRIYTIRMNQLGSPCYPRNLIQNILKKFPANSRIFIVQYNKKTIGAGFTICYNGFVEIPWAATLIEYNNLCPNNLLYWAIIKHYCLEGEAVFDFGRCTVGSSTYRFKKQWGSKPVNLFYQYWIHADKELLVLNSQNPSYQKRIELWKKMPLWFTRLVGPYISRNLP
jgi:serine/alanine adding enzyme